MPKTAVELGLDCAVCHAPAVWFDYGRGKRDHRAGFVCDDHPKIGQREKLLAGNNTEASRGPEMLPAHFADPRAV